MSDLINKFILDNEKSIKNIYLINGHDELKFQEFKDNLHTSLSKDFDESLALYKVNELIKLLPKNNIVVNNKKYICPGCLFFNEKKVCRSLGNYLSCNECKENFNNEKDIVIKKLYKTFLFHSTSGYKCPSCSRFLPKTIEENNNIICPYLDCIFVGKPIKKMNHPSDIISDDFNIKNYENNNNLKTSFIHDIIIEEKNKIIYTNNNFNLIHKTLVYNAFIELLDEYPEDMKNYLCNNSRRGGFQSKIFQRYLLLLEKSIPFVIRKNKKIYTIDNLLNENLSIFDGISIFESKINNFIIKNETKEYYIGGRDASYVKPFFIGKIIDIVDKKNNKSIFDLIDYYTFNKIKMKDISNIDVIVKHLRVPPHYEMGGMVYVNRVRKNIVSKIKDHEK